MVLLPRRMFCLVLATTLGLYATSLLAAGPDSTLFTFVSGTGDTAGSITVTNANTGSTTTTGLVPHWSPEACAEVLSLAATKIGFKTELSGRSVRIFGRGAVVKAVGPTFTKGDAGASETTAVLAARVQCGRTTSTTSKIRSP